MNCAYAKVMPILLSMLVLKGFSDLVCREQPWCKNSIQTRLPQVLSHLHTVYSDSRVHVFPNSSCQYLFATSHSNVLFPVGAPAAYLSCALNIYSHSWECIFYTLKAILNAEHIFAPAIRRRSALGKSF